jgi:hypothetical protein
METVFVCQDLAGELETDPACGAGDQEGRHEADPG